MKHRSLLLTVLFVSILCFFCLWAQFDRTAILNSQELIVNGADQSETNARLLGLISVIPAFLAVLLAFLTREVNFSLFSGLLSGTLILSLLKKPGLSATPAALLGTLSELSGRIISNSSDSSNVAIVILCFVISGMVAVIARSGGFSSLARKLSGKLTTRRSVSLFTQLLGMLVFFDDYASSLITGSVMKELCDKHKITREKLAYLIDSCAAPVSATVLISSWIGTQLSGIQDGLDLGGSSLSAITVFLGALPFCFYNLLSLVFLFLNSLTGRDFGPMLEAERRSLGTKTKAVELDEVAEEHGSLWLAVIPILLLCVLSVWGFYRSAHQIALEQGMIAAGAAMSWTVFMQALGSVDVTFILLEAAIVASLVSILLSICTRTLTPLAAINSWIEGVGDLMPTILILIMVWSLADVSASLGTSNYLVGIISLHVPALFIPLLIFLSCSLIGFGIGSFGCMLMVMPIAVPIGLAVNGLSALPDGPTFLFLCAGAVFSGAIFGDHCSPISDTTILSSVCSDCGSIEHADTQLPYGLSVLGVTALCFLLSTAGVTWPITFLLGILFCLAILLVFGRKPDTLI